MLKFRPTMDPCALDAVRDGQVIASLQWHPERAPRVVFLGQSPTVTLDEVNQMGAILTIEAGQARNTKGA